MSEKPFSSEDSSASGLAPATADARGLDGIRAREDEGWEAAAQAYDAGVDAACDALETLYKAALTVEWCGPDYKPVEGPLWTGRVSCPWCRHVEVVGGSPIHRPGCGLWSALRLAQATLATGRPDKWRFAPPPPDAAQPGHPGDHNEPGFHRWPRAAAPREGVCCSCGYDGEEETDCPKREDDTHCEHWWDGAAEDLIRQAAENVRPLVEAEERAAREPIPPHRLGPAAVSAAPRRVTDAVEAARRDAERDAIDRGDEVAPAAAPREDEEWEPEVETCDLCAGSGWLTGWDTDPQGGHGPHGRKCPRCAAAPREGREP